MRYFLIAGETSGDKHAAHLMKSLLERDRQAEFCFIGGDEMRAIGGVCLVHYSTIAYMGFISVATHALTILRAMSLCKRCIRRWLPDVVILVDYPGFNLPIARYVSTRLHIPTYYYISPKIWAWKEGRIRQIRKYVSELFSILPFEVDFYEGKHNFAIYYVGNPSVDEIEEFKQHSSDTTLQPGKRVIALLPGSREQEIKSNLERMIRSVARFRGEYEIMICAVSSLNENVYRPYLSEGVQLVWDKTYEVLSVARAALVTSGTATLEVALFEVPQVVCYYARLGKVVRALKPYFLKVRFISLVNLIAGRKVVPELIGDEMNPARLELELNLLLHDTPARQAQLSGYADMRSKLGGAGCADRAASQMIELLNQEE